MVDLDEYRDELKEAARGYIRAGLPITVCEGKNPGGVMGEGWHRKNVTPEMADAWIDAAKWPAIGVKQGMSGGIIDFDIDSASELAAFMELFDQAPPVMPAYFSGREEADHRLCASCEELNATGAATITFHTADGSHKLTARIGAGGMAAHSVVPPSRHAKKTGEYSWEYTGKTYAWKRGLSLDDVAPPAAPSSVVRKLLAAFNAKHKAKSPRNAALAGVHPTALDAIKRCTAKMEDGGDGSKRLFAAACRCVELNCSDAEAVATIRAYAVEKPFPRDWSDDEILQRIRDAENTVERGSEVLIANFEEVEIAGEDGEPETISVPLTPSIITLQARLATGDWPRRNGGTLFVDDPKHGLGWFEKSPTPSLFGYFRDRAKVKWVTGGSFVSQTEYASEYHRTATTYDSIETTPHEPMRGATYYRCDVPPAGDGRYLRKFLDLFRPETPIDRDLIQAAAMSLLWGGPFGAIPAFAITSDQGRGVGKTTCVQLLARLVGGSIDVSHNEDGDKLSTRLLAPAARTKRVVSMDNIKASKLSSEKIEGLITANEISGRQLYVGEGTRPNNLIWFLTLNGPSMASDLAQRSIFIKLVRGDNSGPWLESANKFIDDNRQRLIGDIIGALRAKPFPLESFGRWAAWEQAVLSRLPEPGEAQRVIVERQGAANCDLDEGELVQGYFANQLELLGYDPDEDQVRIPSATAAMWFAKSVGEPMRTAAACRRINQMHGEGQLPRLSADPGRRHGRCFIWRGENADIFEGEVLNDFQARCAIHLSRPFYSN